MFFRQGQADVFMVKSSLLKELRMATTWSSISESMTSMPGKYFMWSMSLL
jgi:hypothetical protein